MTGLKTQKCHVITQRAGEQLKFRNLIFLLEIAFYFLQNEIRKKKQQHICDFCYRQLITDVEVILMRRPFKSPQRFEGQKMKTDASVIASSKALLLSEDIHDVGKKMMDGSAFNPKTTCCFSSSD